METHRKLKLNGILSYLPYGLKFIKQDTGIVVTAIGCDMGMNGEIYFCFDHIKNPEGLSGANIGGNIMPLLRPMSDIGKPMMHNGEEIVPLVELLKISASDMIERGDWKVDDFEVVGDEVRFLYLIFRHVADGVFGWRYDFDTNGTRVARGQSEMRELLHQLHFDYYGFIDLGLARNINEI